MTHQGALKETMRALEADLLRVFFKEEWPLRIRAECQCEHEVHQIEGETTGSAHAWHFETMVSPSHLPMLAVTLYICRSCQIEHGPHYGRRR